GRRRHTRFSRDWSSDVCSSDLSLGHAEDRGGGGERGEDPGDPPAYSIGHGLPLRTGGLVWTHHSKRSSISSRRSFAFFCSQRFSGAASGSDSGSPSITYSRSSR